MNGRHVPPPPPPHARRPRIAAAARWLAFASALCIGGCKDDDRLPLLPVSCPVKGIDVSRHQGDIDWHAVAQAGIKFAWFKATEGGDHGDAKFRRNWTLAWANGVRRGAYHFVYWCRRAEYQVAWFVSNVPADPDALPPVLDVEWNPGSRSCPQKRPREAALADMKIILAQMEKTYGQKPIIYAPLDFYLEVMEDDLDDYPLWVRDVTGTALAGYGRRKWLILQHSETGRVPGIAGDVDLDCFEGDLRRWRRWVKDNTKDLSDRGS